MTCCTESTAENHGESDYINLPTNKRIKMKTLLVVPYFNGVRFLPNLLSTIPKDHYVLIVDTGSTEKESIDYFNSIETNKYILKDKTKIPGYGIGAYILAYEKYKFDSYFWLHDSMIIKDDKFLTEYLDKGNVVAWLRFPMHEQFNDYIGYMESDYGSLSDAPSYGIFGPIMYIKRDVIKKMRRRGMFKRYPTCKQDQCSFERGLAIALKRIGQDVYFLEDYDYNRIDNTRDYKHFDKIRPLRT